MKTLFKIHIFLLLILAAPFGAIAQDIVSYVHPNTIEGYGHGATIADINKDGWKDIF